MMSKQKYSYTYDNALNKFFVRDVESDELLLECTTELAAVVFIQGLITGEVDINLFNQVVDLTLGDRK